MRHIYFNTSLMFLFCVSSIELNAQVIFSDDFSNNSNWTIDVSNADCGGDGVTFGSDGSRFVISDVEGGNCGPCTDPTVGCTTGVGICGDNLFDASMVMDPVSIIDYSSITVNLDISSSGTLECHSCTSADLLIGTYILTPSGTNGTLFSVCGNTGTGNISIPITNTCDEFVIIDIRGGTTAQDEFYYLDNLTITGAGSGSTPVINSVMASESLPCEGENLTLTADVSNCTSCTFEWEHQESGTTFNTSDPVLSLTNLAVSDGGVYLVTATQMGCTSTPNGTGFSVLVSYPGNLFPDPFCNTDASSIDVVDIYETSFGVSGTMAGPGIQADNRSFSPLGLTAGADVIYFLPNDGCDTTDIPITISGGSDITLNTIGPFCYDQGIVILDDTQDGQEGVWSGPGVTGSIFDPNAAGVGTHLLSFDPNDPCFETISIQVQVLACPECWFEVITPGNNNALCVHSDGNTQVHNNLEVGGDLNVLGNTTVDGSLQINGGLIVNGVDVYENQKLIKSLNEQNLKLQNELDAMKVEMLALKKLVMQTNR